MSYNNTCKRLHIKRLDIYCENIIEKKEKSLMHLIIIMIFFITLTAQGVQLRYLKKRKYPDSADIQDGLKYSFNILKHIYLIYNQNYKCLNDNLPNITLELLNRSTSLDVSGKSEQHYIIMSCY